MCETKFPRVEHLALEGATLTIHFVSEDGMSEVFEVDAHLMGASCVQRAFDNRAASEFAENAPCCLRNSTFERIHHRHFLPVRGMATEMVFHDAVLFLEASAREREVDF